MHGGAGRLLAPGRSARWGDTVWWTQKLSSASPHTMCVDGKSQQVSQCLSFRMQQWLISPLPLTPGDCNVLYATLYFKSTLNVKCMSVNWSGRTGSIKHRKYESAATAFASPLQNPNGMGSVCSLPLSLQCMPVLLVLGCRGAAVLTQIHRLPIVWTRHSLSAPSLEVRIFKGRKKNS